MHAVPRAASGSPSKAQAKGPGAGASPVGSRYFNAAKDSSEPATGQASQRALPRPSVAMDARPVARLLHKVDFERLLATRSRRRSAHFALHYVSGPPVAPQRGDETTGIKELSTGLAPAVNKPVQNSRDQGIWFGCVVPKRHARRAVTRNLVKRQMREAFRRHGRGLTGGLWLVRLSSPISTVEFVSARSSALAMAVRSELDSLLAHAAA